MDKIQRFLMFFFHRKYLGLFVVLAFLIGMGISTVYRGAFSHKQRTDFTVYLTAAQEVTKPDGNIYAVENSRHWHYVYSPLLAILLVPFVHWPLALNVLLWYLLSLAALAWVFSYSSSLNPDPRSGPWPIALAAILCIPVFLNTLTRGQLGILSLFFALLIFALYLKKKKFLAGFLLAFAITLKTSPLAFLLFFFFIKKEWKILFSSLIGFLVFFVLIPSWSLGFMKNWDYLMLWNDLMKVSTTDAARQNYLWGELYTPFASDNQSFYAVLTRWVWPSENSFAAGTNFGVRWVTFGLGLFGVFWIWLKNLSRKTPLENPIRLLAEYSLFPMLMLFISPVTQIHHYTVIYLLFLAALFLIGKNTPKTTAQKSLLWGVWIAAVSLTLNAAIPFLAYWGCAMWSAFFLWFLVLFSFDPKRD